MRPTILMTCLLFSLSSNCQIFTLPYFEDFESFTADTNQNPGDEPFLLFNGWVNDSLDDAQDWVTRSIPAYQSQFYYTGPTGDHTAGSGVYLYLNDDYGDFQNVTVFSPGMNAVGVTQGLEFSYWIHSNAFADSSERIIMEISNDQLSWTQMDSVSTLSFYDVWTQRIIDISAFGGDTIYFKFRGSTNRTGYPHDFGIDDVRVEVKPFQARLLKQNVICRNDQNGWITFSASYGQAPYSVTWSNSSMADTLFNLDTGIYCATITDANLATINICDTIFQADSLGFTTEALNHVCRGDSIGSASVDSVWGGWTRENISTLAFDRECTSSSSNLLLDNGTHLPTPTQYPAIFGNWYSSNRTQLMYRADELANKGVQEGLITHIGIPIVSIGTARTDFHNFEIKIGGTTAPSLGSSFDTNLFVVYSVPVYEIIGDTAWIDFDIPFYWNGTDNLILDICTDNRSFAYSRNVVTYQTAVSYRAVLSRSSDIANPCEDAETTNYPGYWQYRPNLIIGTCASSFSESEYAYVWSTGDTLRNVYDKLWAGYHYVTVTDLQGCSVTDSVLITSNDSSGVFIDNLANGAFCKYSYYTADAGSGFQSYLWSTGDTSQILDISTAGNYIIIVEDSIGCRSSDTIYVAQYYEPIISWVVSDEMFGNDGSVNVNVTGAYNPQTYIWSNGDTTEDLTNVSAGIYELILTNAVGCKDTIVVTIGSQVGLDENQVSFQIYPNPSDGVFIIESSANSGDLLYELYDNQGRLLKRIHPTNLSYCRLDLSDQNDGIYFLRIQKGKEFQVVKIVKK